VTNENQGDSWGLVNYLDFAPSITLALIVLNRALYHRTRRKLLETGILSIPSCGAIWLAVVVAHYRAIRAQMVEDSLGNHEAYLTALSKEGARLSRTADDLHKYVERRAYVRVGGDFKGRLLWCSSEYELAILDVSKAGACIACEAGIGLGQGCEIRIEGVSQSLKAEVVWVSGNRKGLRWPADDALQPMLRR
jgi:PilZ domain